MIEADLAERYGADLDDPTIRARSWRWLRVRIEGLLAVPPVYHAEPTPTGLRYYRVQQTRIGLQLEPPPPPPTQPAEAADFDE